MLSEDLVEVEVSRIGSRFSSGVCDISSQIKMFSYFHGLVSTHAVSF